MKQKLIGKNAIVTGASSGIGRATALALAKQGANVALIARNEARLNAVAAEVRALGVQAEVLLADIRDEAQLKAAVDGAVERFGVIHICHCNAGIYLRCPAAELTQAQIRGMMENNFFGNLSTAYAILPHFRAQGGGHLIVTVSMDGKKGVPPDAAYVATKFALNGFFQVMRQELRREGIHVGMIFPSRTDTPQIAHVACPKITPKASPDKMANAASSVSFGTSGKCSCPICRASCLSLPTRYHPASATGWCGLSSSTVCRPATRSFEVPP